MKENLEMIEVWSGALASLKETKNEMNDLEKRMLEIRDACVEDMMKNIRMLIKDHEEKTGDDWESYLVDFDIFNSVKGDFQRSIKTYIKSELKELCKALEKDTEEE